MTDPPAEGDKPRWVDLFGIDPDYLETDPMADAEARLSGLLADLRALADRTESLARNRRTQSTGRQAFWQDSVALRALLTRYEDQP